MDSVEQRQLAHQIKINENLDQVFDALESKNRNLTQGIIAAGLAPFAPETAAIKAGRLLLKEIEHCVQHGESFAFETTLAGQNYLRHIEQWRTQSYRVSLYFFYLPNAETAIARVETRVRQGGHNIPEPIIRRRFAVGWKNFQQHYKQVVDDWALYDPVRGKPRRSGRGRIARTA